MLRRAKSKTNERNPAMIALARLPAEGNIGWSERALNAMPPADTGAWTCITLLGGSDTLSFRLRVAQSHMRSDMLPSYWSEAAILVRADPISMADAHALHVPLPPSEASGFAPSYNGVVKDPFGYFDDALRFPNIALIAIPVPQQRVVERVDSFRRARSTLDALEHLLRWLAFAWGVAKTGNPLHENYGIPSSCMLETVFAAEDFDLTPGLESRASCPEAVWSAALYWQEYFAQTGVDGRVPFGRYFLGHSYPIVEPDAPDRAAPAAAKQARAVSRGAGASKTTTRRGTTAAGEGP